MGMAFIGGTRDIPAAIAPSAAGIRGGGLLDQSGAEPLPVMVVHSADDALFPQNENEAAQWWPQGNGCDAVAVEKLGYGWVALSGRADEIKTWYCDDHGPHPVWPRLNGSIIEFLKAAPGGRSLGTVPFTPTHILAVVPIGYAWPRAFPFSALVIGSMVPDWPLYIPVGPSYTTTHSLAGIAIACLPLGLCAYAFFQVALKRPLFELLPESLRQKLIGILQSSAPFCAGTLLRAGLAVTLGAMTHIVWDAFTHQGRWGVQMLPVLDSVAFTVAGVDVRGYKLLQHGSTALGIPLLCLFLVAWLRARLPQPVAPAIVPPPVRTILLMVFIAAPLGYAAIGAVPLTPDLSNRTLIDFVTRTGFALVVLVACYGAVFYPFIRMRRRRR